jgi:hypothetical protein
MVSRIPHPELVGKGVELPDGGEELVGRRIEVCR